MKNCWRCGTGMDYSQVLEYWICPKCGRRSNEGISGKIGPVHQDWWDAEHPKKEVVKKKLPSIEKRVEKLRREYVKERKKKNK
jgi:anaerobic ribonucleoside-triphosphate reductase